VSPESHRHNIPALGEGHGWGVVWDRRAVRGQERARGQGIRGGAERF
jgi:hypothetical protein